MSSSEACILERNIAVSSWECQIHQWGKQGDEESWMTCTSKVTPLPHFRSTSAACAHFQRGWKSLYCQRKREVSFQTDSVYFHSIQFCLKLQLQTRHSVHSWENKGKNSPTWISSVIFLALSLGELSVFLIPFKWLPHHLSPYGHFCLPLQF